MKRRIITMLLVLCMICSMLPLTALAAEQIDGGTFGDSLSWTLDSEGTLTITGSGPMISSDPMAEVPWLESHQDDIRNVVIADGVTSIADSAFEYCENLVSVSIADSVTEIGAYAFYYCYSLESITIPDGVTTIGEYAFSNCTSLKSIVIPDSVTTLKWEAFSDCSSLESAKLPKNLTVLNGSMFQNCTSLTDVTLPEGLTEIGDHAFYNCAKLDHIDLPDSITLIDNYAFHKSGLRQITLPQKLTDIGWCALSWCRELRYLVIPASVTEIQSGAFYYSEIETFVFEGDAPIIGADAFEYLSPTVFYPAGNETWTDEVMQDYGAYSVIWTDMAVESVEVEDMRFMAGTHGYSRSTGYFYYDYNPTVTITLTDGTVYRTTGSDVEIGGDYLPVIFMDDQSEENPWGVGDHKATVFFGPVQTDFTITITESDIVGFEVPDMVMTVGVDGQLQGYYDENDEWVPDAWVKYDVDPRQITLHFKDGTSITEYTDYLEEEYDTWLYFYQGQSYENQWGVGTHTVTAEFMGMLYDYQVTIQEFPIERIEVAPVVLTQGVDGYWNEYDNDGNWLNDKWFEYDVEPEVITVYYTDGTNATYSRDEIYDALDFDFRWTTDQDYDNQWGVGTHTATASLGTITCEFQVIIQESPVDRIEVAPLTKEAYIGGDWGFSWDEELGEWVAYTWFHYDVYPETMTVYYKDGTVLSGTPEEIYEKTGHYVESSNTQSSTNPWGPGTHTATAFFMGISCEYQVTIKECTVERIEVAPVVMQAYTHGSWQDTWDDETGETFENTWFFYDAPAEVITIYYKDGTTLTGTPEEIYEKTGAEVNCDYGEPQNSDTPWGIGTHTATAFYRGVRCEYQVVIEENPVERIEVAPLTLVAEAHGRWRGYWDENDDWVEKGWFEYDITPVSMTLYMKDGTVRSGTVEELEELYGIRHSSTSNQSNENKWGVGTYTATASFMNFTCEYQVTIVENPVERIEAAPITLRKDIDGHTEIYWDWEDPCPWFCYNTRPDNVTVYFNDGTVVSGTPEEIEAQTGYEVTWEDEQDYFWQWRTAGTYTATAKFLGRTYEYEVTIVEAEKDYTVTYTSASISLAGDIGVNYYATLSDDVLADEGAYMQFTVAGQTQTVPLSEAVVGTDGTYRFSCKVAAKQMTENITGQFYLSDGTAVGESKVYSVKAYCDAAIPVYSQYPAYADLVELMEAMLNYGGYSQVQFGYNTDNLANAGLDTTLPTITAADVDAYAHGATGEEAGISVASVSLLLESTTTIRFYFKLDGTKSIEEYTFYVDGVETAPIAADNGQYYVDKVNVAAKDLDEMVTVTVGGLTARYCGLSYVRQVAVLYPSYYSEALINVAKALYDYNLAANAYFG